VVWGGANLSLVDWEALRRLGDERLARQRRTRDGKRKDAETRRDEFANAVRAYRQVASVLRAQGLSEFSDRYAYRAQILQLKVFWWNIRALPAQALTAIQEEATWYGKLRALALLSVIALGFAASQLGRIVGSLLLGALAGHGYRPSRTLIAYLAVIFGFMYAYLLATQGVLTFGLAPSHLAPLQWYEALILSVSSFHGRGFFQPVQSLGDPVAVLAAAEAIFGLVIEVSFIATFTQRFFGSK
jgi:hypothetical protein